jgi:hypothetical protein
MHLARALAASDTRLGADTTASLLLGGLFRLELTNFGGTARPAKAGLVLSRA